MYRAALTRGEVAAAREREASARAESLGAREQAIAERESLANSRDRSAVERDAIANQRDQAALDREGLWSSRPDGATITAAGDEDFELERARLEAELQRAHLDALTGAFRREMGRLALRNEIERARRADGRFVIAFVDVDDLKGVNDRDGHAAGDRVLRMLAATMRANLRSYDPIVRFGGDEFVCGISSIDPGEVQHRIGVIDQSLRQSTGVGITAGLAALTSGESLEELTARADAALIEAKRSRDE
jgi:diguanylate cyclase (GGDEF)-like protein